jgi:phosphatidylglycerol:prolipoprotein diacylglycerol transferase
VDPVLVQFGPLVIRWYGLMHALTIAVGLWLAYRFGPRFGVPAAVLDRIGLWAVVAMYVGGRLGYVLSHPAEFRDPLEVFRVWHGGLASHGAILAGLAYCTVAARRAGVSVQSLFDAGAFALPVGSFFVRFGNFMNGELYGAPTTLPVGVRFPTAPDAPRHPVQLYEMALALVILVVVWRVARRRAFPGQVWWTALALVSLVRLGLDVLRPEYRVWGVLATGQVAALLLLGVSLWFLWRRPTAPAASLRHRPDSGAST